MQGSWLVLYQDGTSLAQYDATHPAAVGGEVPMRAIEWPRVTTLQLASQSAVTDFTIPALEGVEYRLVQRTMMTFQGSATIYLLLMLSPGYAYPFEQRDVVRAIYWVPDGTTHDCPHFECPDVARYLQQFVWGREAPPLAPTHDTLNAAVDAVIG